MAAALYLLQNRAYQQYLTQIPDADNAVSFREWCDMQYAEQPQFKYWELTLQIELMLLQIQPWLIVLDHTNYCRWLPEHISAMVKLPKNHPEIYRQFKEGHFAVQKTKNVFSALVIDQCIEQH